MHSRKERSSDPGRCIPVYCEVHHGSCLSTNYKEIADALGISMSTVRRHIQELIDEEILETDAEPGTQRAFRIRGTRVGKRGKEHE